MVPAEPAEIRTVYGQLYSTDKLGNLFKCSTLLFEFIPFMEAMNFFFKYNTILENSNSDQTIKNNFTF